MSIGKALHRGLEREDVSSLIEAHDWLSGLANRDCDCRWMPEAAQRDSPCDVCQARRAMDALSRVIDPTPRTLHPQRLVNQAERVYFDLWVSNNERQRHVNGGFTLIEHLLCPENEQGQISSRPATVSQHDMTIATTIIQWLGTSCGRGFVEQAENEIRKRNAERSKWGTLGMGCRSPEVNSAAWVEREKGGELFQVADSIASQFISSERHRSVHDHLRAAILNALIQTKGTT